MRGLLRLDPITADGARDARASSGACDRALLQRCACALPAPPECI